jgi:hypothetical protein
MYLQKLQMVQTIKAEHGGVLILTEEKDCDKNGKAEKCNSLHCPQWKGYVLNNQES